jgi:hypothetical protein
MAKGRVLRALFESFLLFQSHHLVNAALMAGFLGEGGAQPDIHDFHGLFLGAGVHRQSRVITLAVEKIFVYLVFLGFFVHGLTKP